MIHPICSFKYGKKHALVVLIQETGASLPYVLPATTAAEAAELAKSLRALPQADWDDLQQTTGNWSKLARRRAYEQWLLELGRLFRQEKGIPLLEYEQQAQAAKEALQSLGVTELSPV